MLEFEGQNKRLQMSMRGDAKKWAHAFQDMVEVSQEDWVDDNDTMLDDALQGQTQIEVSHAGSEFSHLLNNILSRLSKEKSCYKNAHPRRDCEELSNDLFAKQIVDLRNAYMQWSSTRGKDGLDNVDVEEPEGILREKYGLWVIDVYTWLSICLDLYLSILSEVNMRVKKSLKHDGSNFRIQISYSCCMYKLEGEPGLHFKKLITIDGNNSQKHVRHHVVTYSMEKLNEGKSIECTDSRCGGGDYFLSREQKDDVPALENPYMHITDSVKSCSWEHTSMVWGWKIWRVVIACYFEHLNSHETFESLSTFLSNNYKQALGILHDVSSLCDTMVNLKIGDVGVFDQWLEEEKSYLKGLTLALTDLKIKLNKVTAVFVNDGPQANGKNINSCQIETTCHQSQEHYQVKLDEVLSLELEMGSILTNDGSQGILNGRTCWLISTIAPIRGL
ncbi:hypothetical protein ARMGADRAFT_1107157 [Armillaria gallica]|uniref:Uncharacterized protein n=1 Tax=Armillaria gallica TaxID=47427 RepID=A0A2H3DAW7_ARMGA|nr:hypothetical protein ARMGADRAFT_1107157 [Armillaria gallica]